MATEFVMAIDAGGGGGHALLVELGSGAITRAFRPWRHPSAAGTGGLGTDLDLAAIWQAVGEAAREARERAGARPEQVGGIAVTSMRHTTIALDGKGQVLLAAANRDARAVGEALELASLRGDELYDRTGQWPGPIASAARLRWLQSARREESSRVATVLALSDWLAFRLCGELATDASQAAPTLLLDVARREWSRDLAGSLGVDVRRLAEIRPSGSPLGKLGAEAAAHLGLCAGTTVAVGGGDTQCALLGAGGAKAGFAAVVAGTTVPVVLAVPAPRIDPGKRLWTGCHVVPSLWTLEANGGPMGETLDWLARLLHPRALRPVARFLAEAAEAEPVAGGFVSTVGGDRMDARRLDLPVGTITLSHLASAGDPLGRAHLERAVVDGMGCALRANVELLAEVAEQPIEAMALTGGMSRSPLFRGVVSAALDRPVQVGAAGEATGLGAAMCAAVGAGQFSDLAEAARSLAGPRDVVRPDADTVRTYGRLYEVWTKLREARVETSAPFTGLVLPAVLGHRVEPAAASAGARPRVLVTAEMDGDSLAHLRRFADVEYAPFRTTLRLLSGKTLAEAAAGVQVLVTEVDVVDAGALSDLPDLRVVVACRGDAVNVDVAACAAFGIPVLHAPGRNADAVADLTLGFLVMLARKLPQATAFLHQPGIAAGDMGRMGQAFGALQGRELSGKVVGLIGFGAVGRAVAMRLEGFGARILVSDPYASPEEVERHGAEPVDLAMLLEQSDLVSLHAAVTDATRGMIGAGELARMKRGSFLVNTARGALVDESALAEALRAGRLAGAALDVFAVEPPGSDHPLLQLESVIATPHVGGNTADVARHQGQIVVEDLARLVAGARPKHVLDPEVLAGFDWGKPRPVPDRAALEAIAKRPPPAVTDLARTAAPSRAATAAVVPGAAEVAPQMKRLLESFLARVAKDSAIGAFAVDRSVLLRFTLADLGLVFHLGLDRGAVRAAVGEPSAPADVELGMSALVFDGMFTGEVDAMEAALSGRLSFRGDTVKAMTLRDLQEDLGRLYRAARDEVGGPGDLSRLAPVGNGRRVVAAGGADPREEIVRTVGELYAGDLITATGGNVSARSAGAEREIWITPSHVFKGDLRPDMLIRLDLEGRPLDEGQPSPSSEARMHCLVYQARPEARAVIHAHAPHATVLVDSDLPFVPVSTEAAFFGDIPRIPFLMPGSEDLARAVAEAMRESWAVLLKNHGLIVAGRSLRRAADIVEIIDRSAEIILGCHAVGRTPPALPVDVVQRLRRMGDVMA